MAYTTAHLQAYSDSFIGKSAYPTDDPSLETLAACLRDERVVITGANQATQVLIAHFLSRLAHFSSAELEKLNEPVRDLLLAYLAYDLELSGTIERILTALRRALLEELCSGHVLGGFALDLLAALATFCFSTEYIFQETAEETIMLDALNPSRDVAHLAAVGCFKPLHGVEAAQGWLGRPALSSYVRHMLSVQVLEPAEERRLKSEIGSLSPVRNDTSALVRAMYEENPYPRWTRYPVPLRDHALTSANFDILVAGCGTGQHPLQTAIQNPASRVVALDLSLTSLAYAARKARAYGVSNVTFIQGDILEIEKLGMAFHHVSAVGVLHHMKNPEAGLEALLRVLLPGGQIDLGFYSEIARGDIIAAIKLREAGGFAPTLEGIRNFRQMVLQLPIDVPARKVKFIKEFFSVSGCRDLLFHVQEHRLSLPMLSEILHRHSLTVAEVVVPMEVKAAFRGEFPTAADNDLEAWAHFEDKHPETFISMYRVVAKKQRTETAAPYGR